MCFHFDMAQTVREMVADKCWRPIRESPEKKRASPSLQVLGYALNPAPLVTLRAPEIAFFTEKHGGLQNRGMLRESERHVTGTKARFHGLWKCSWPQKQQTFFLLFCQSTIFLLFFFRPPWYRIDASTNINKNSTHTTTTHPLGPESRQEQPTTKRKKK